MNAWWIVPCMPFIMVIAIVWIVQKNKNERRKLSTDDDAIIQDLTRGIERMEERIVNLETILASRNKARDFESKL